MIYPSPTPEQIREARKMAGMTQSQAADRVLAGSYRTWQKWESGERAMPASVWALWQLKAVLHDS